MRHPKSIIIILIILLLSGMFFGATCFGAEVVMKSGERFQTSQVWERSGKIRFNMHGLIVDVSKDDVAAVIHDQDPTPNESSPGRAIDGMQTDLVPDPNGNTMRRNFNAPAAETTPNNDPAKSPYFDMNRPPLSTMNHGTGFEGIYWQMRPQEISGLEKVETDPAFGGIDQYWRPDQSLQWGRVTLDGWVYGFWKDQLYSILMWVNGWSEYEKLRKQVSAVFGPGSQNQEGRERWVWNNPASQRMLEFDRELGTGILIMRSTGVDARIKKLYPGYSNP